MINKEQKQQLANMLINNQITIPEFLTLVDGLPIIHVKGDQQPDTELYSRAGIQPVIIYTQTKEAKIELLRLIRYEGNKNKMSLTN